MPWIRSGTCNRCGDCCKSGDPFNGELGEGEIKNACPLLKMITENGVQLATCKIRVGEAEENPYHQNACIHWPFAPDQIANYPNCSYTFEWVESN
jgi:hypothetical protein